MIRRALPFLALLPLFLLALGSQAAEMSCLDCHPDKNKNVSVHPAVAMGCDSCHSGTHMGEKPAPKLTAAPPDLCFNCHDRDSFSKKVQHPPVAAGMCLDCHDPHASGFPKLLKQNVPDLCFTCHDQAQFTKKVQHPPAAGGMCLTCHTPHAGEIEKLLTTALPDLCLTCHEQQASGKHIMKDFGLNDTHPVKDRLDPSRPGRTLSCVSCHNPHSSERANLFQGPAAAGRRICGLCHRKISVVPTTRQ
jgi:predicted CXXCH cytochrome family protein